MLLNVIIIFYYCDEQNLSKESINDTSIPNHIIRSIIEILDFIVLHLIVYFKLIISV